MVSEAIHTLESEQRKEVRSREAGFVELDARLQSLEAVVEEQRSQIEGLLAKAEEYERLEEQRRIEEQKRVEKQKRLAELRRKRQLEQKRIENEKRKREALTASGGDEPAADTGRQSGPAVRIFLFPIRPPMAQLLLRRTKRTPTRPPTWPTKAVVWMRPPRASTGSWISILRANMLIRHGIGSARPVMSSMAIHWRSMPSNI